MSRPIFAAAAAVAANLPPALSRQAQKSRFCELEPSLRIIEGRVLYSAAWLDQWTSYSRISDAEARFEGRPKGGLGG